MKLTNEKLLNIKGGASKSSPYTWIILGVGALISLVSGIFNGYANPTKCKN